MGPDLVSSGSWHGSQSTYFHNPGRFLTVSGLAYFARRNEAHWQLNE